LLAAQKETAEVEKRLLEAQNWKRHWESKCDDLKREVSRYGAIMNVGAKNDTKLSKAHGQTLIQENLRKEAECRMKYMAEKLNAARDEKVEILRVKKVMEAEAASALDQRRDLERRLIAMAKVTTN